MGFIPQPEKPLYQSIRACRRCVHWNKLPIPHNSGICEIEEVKDYNKSMVRPVTDDDFFCSSFKPRFQLIVNEKFEEAKESSK